MVDNGIVVLPENTLSAA